jgi:mono/diheme cytochrome c family protein
MSASLVTKAGRRLACRSCVVRGLVLTTVAALAGILLLTRSEASAQTAGNARPAASVAAGNVEKGKAIYNKIGCWECHGRDAQSGRPTLGPAAMPFPAFVNQLRNPREDMPPYTVKVLSDADVADIYAFVKSVPTPPRLETIPLLK